MYEFPSLDVQESLLQRFVLYDRETEIAWDWDGACLIDVLVDEGWVIGGR